MKCINLRERFGGRFRIRWEEPATPRSTDPWYQYIPCVRGRIYPHGGEELGFATGNHPKLVGMLKRLPFVTIAQDGCDGANVIFHVDYFGQIAKIAKPYKRKQISEKERARLRKVHAEFRKRHPDWKPGQAIANTQQIDT